MLNLLLKDEDFRKQEHKNLRNEIDMLREMVTSVKQMIELAKGMEN